MAYPPEVVAEIQAHVLAEVACGRSVTRILREDEGMPAASQFWRWTFNSPQYQEQLTRAREFGVDVLLDEIEDIADDSSSDVYIDYVGKGDDRNPVAKVDGDVIRRASLRIETRIKKAQMLAPRRYGNKLDLTSGGEKLEAGQVNDNRLQAIVGVVAQRKAAKQLPKPEEETPDEA